MNDGFAAAEAVRSAAARMLRPPAGITAPAVELRFEDPAVSLARALGGLLPEPPSDQSEPVVRNESVPRPASRAADTTAAKVVDPGQTDRPVVETNGPAADRVASSAVTESVERRDNGVRTQANAASPGRTRESVRLVRGAASLTSVLETAAGRSHTDAQVSRSHTDAPVGGSRAGAEIPVASQVQHEDATAWSSAHSVRPGDRPVPTTERLVQPARVAGVDSRRVTDAQPVPLARETLLRHVETPSAPATAMPAVAMPTAPTPTINRRESTMDNRSIDLDAITSEVAERLRDQLEWEFLRNYGTGELP